MQMLAPQSYDVIVILPKDQFVQVVKRKEGMFEAIEEHVKGSSNERLVDSYRYSL